jgi:hypothetical protein
LARILHLGAVCQEARERAVHAGVAAERDRHSITAHQEEAV